MNETAAHTATTGTALPDTQERPYTDRKEGRPEAMTKAPAARSTGSSEPMTRLERLLVALLTGVFALLAAVVTAGAVGYTALSGQMLEGQQNLREEIGTLREEIGTLRGEIGTFRGEIGTLRGEIGTLRVEMHEQLRGISDRLTRIETFLQVHHGPLPPP